MHPKLYPLQVVACTFILCSQLTSATIAVPLSGSARNFCEVVKLPRWPGPEPTLDFRQSPGAMLVGVSSSPLLRQTEIDTSRKYAIDFDRGVLRLANGDEWQAAQSSRLPPYPDYRAAMDASRNPKYEVKGDTVVYQGKSFPKTGKKWPFDNAYAARFSPGNRYVAVNSWGGHLRSYNDEGWPTPFFQSPSRGDLNVAVYDTNSGAQVFSFQPHFRGDVVLDHVFERSGWITGRYYIFFLDDYERSEFVLCDFNGGRPANRKPLKTDLHESVANNQPTSSLAKIGTVTDRAITDPEGEIVSIDVSLGLIVQKAGQYRVSLDLVASNGQAAKQAELLQLDAGEQSVTLHFPAASLRALGTDGPYSMAHVRVVLLSKPSDLMADYVDKASATQGYLLLGSPSIGFTGRNSLEGRVTGSGPKFDVLRVDVGVISATQTSCTIRGELIDAAGHKVDYVASRALSVGPGAGSLPLNFNGIRVSQSAGSPYKIGEPNVSCDNGAMKLARSPFEIAGPAPAEFTYAAPDFELLAIGYPPPGDPGSPVTFELKLVSSGAFNALVRFDVSGLPPGAIPRFRTRQLLGEGANQLTITTTPTTPPGSYPISISYSGATITGQKILKSLPLTLTIEGLRN